MIELEREGPVFVLRMRETGTRMGPDWLGACAAALDEVESASGAAALVTTGWGRNYSTGLDLEALMGPDRERVPAFMDGLHELFARLLGFRRPTVAALNGHTFAGGAMLALAHDFRIMREDRGFFCLPEIDLETGRPPTPGMLALLRARVPAGTLHEALVSGRRYGGSEALECGLVDAAATEDRVVPLALERALALADKDPATLAAIKQSLHADALEVLRRRPALS